MLPHPSGISDLKEKVSQVSYLASFQSVQGCSPLSSYYDLVGHSGSSQYDNRCRVTLVDHLPITFHDVEGQGAAVRIDQVADLQFGQRMTQLSCKVVPHS